MSGGYKGSNGRGTTSGGGIAGVVGGIKRNQRDERGTRPSRRYVNAPVPSAVAAGATLQWTATFPTPFRDNGILATAQVTDANGIPLGVTAIGTVTETDVVVSYRAIVATPAGTACLVRAIHP